MTDDQEARRVALAILRLQEAGDDRSVDELVGGLSVERLRAVLIAQSRNASLAFEASFGTIFEQRLPGLAHRYGLSRDRIVDFYLEWLIFKSALDECDEP